MKILLASKVYDSGGVFCGDLVGAQVDMAARAVTNLVVSTQSGVPERWLPIRLVASAAGYDVWLRCDESDLPVAGGNGHDSQGQVLLTPRLRVDARNGHLGQLFGLQLKPTTGLLTDLLVCRRQLWRMHGLAIDWTYVARLEGNTIYLKLTTAEIRSLEKVAGTPVP